MCVIIVTFAVISTTISSPVLVKMLEDAVTYLFGGTDLKGRLGAHSRLTALLAQPGTLRHNRWSSHSALSHHHIFALGPATSPHLHLCRRFATTGRFGCYWATGEDGGHTQGTYGFYVIPVKCLVDAARNKAGTLQSFLHTLTDGGTYRIKVLLGNLLVAKLASVLIIAGAPRARDTCISCTPKLTAAVLRGFYRYRR